MSSLSSLFFIFFFSSRRRHTRFKCDWSSDVCSFRSKGKEQVMQFKETSDEMKQTGEQITIERLLPLVTLAPGKYSIEIVATDTLANKTVSKSAEFTVKAPVETKTAAIAGAPGRQRQVKQERLRIFGALILAATCLSFVAGAAFAQVRPGAGKLAGAVHDTVGTAQMGAPG